MENVTIRKYIRRSMSETNLSLNSQHSDILNQMESTSLSLHSVLYDDNNPTIHELRDELNSTKLKLESADQEIMNLIAENNQLKHTIEEQSRCIDTLKQFCRDRTKIVSTNTMTPISKRLLNVNMRARSSSFHIKLQHTPATFKSTNGLQSSHKHLITPESRCQVDLASIDKGEDLNYCQTYNTSKETLNSDTCISKNSSTINKSNETCNKKKRVIIIADNNGRGLRSTLQKLLGESYVVTSFVKPNASIGEVVNSMKTEILNLTDYDCVILIGGSNEKYPEKLNIDLNVFLSSVSNTNVIVCEVPRNNYLNVKKLNYYLKFICKTYSSVAFLDLDYSRSIPKRHHFTVHLARCLLKEILCINYKITMKYYQASVRNQNCKSYRDIGTNTISETNCALCKCKNNNNQMPNVINDSEHFDLDRTIIDDTTNNVNNNLIDSDNLFRM